MKKLALIIMPLFMVVSIGVTAFVVMSQSLDIREEAKETQMSVQYSTNPFSDWCPEGPFVEIITTGATYSQSSGKQVLNLKAKRATGPDGTAKIPFSEELRFKTLEEQCANALANPYQCGICSEEDLAFERKTVDHIIPAGEEEITFSLTLNQPPANINCGCTAQTVHILDVSYTLDNTQVDCNTIIPRDKHTVHEFSYAVSLGDNCSISVSQPENKPIVIVTPVASASAVPNVKVKGVESDNKNPKCVSLAAFPLSGTAPLTVHFTGTGFDIDGEVTGFEFDYGDEAVQNISKNIGASGGIEIEHTYTKPGNYTAVLKITDDSGLSSGQNNDCSQIIATSSNKKGQKLEVGSPQVLAQSTGLTITPAPNIVLTNTPTTIPNMQPDVPQSGGSLPTILIALLGMAVLFSGLLVAL